MDRPGTSFADPSLTDATSVGVAADELMGDDVAAADAVLAQSLVEEVSIDGMCGVY